MDERREYTFERHQSGDVLEPFALNELQRAIEVISRQVYDRDLGLRVWKVRIPAGGVPAMSGTIVGSVIGTVYDHYYNGDGRPAIGTVTPLTGTLLNYGPSVVGTTGTARDGLAFREADGRFAMINEWCP